MIEDDVAKWKKRLRRKGPFYLIRTEVVDRIRYDHSTNPVTPYTVPNNQYVVIWNDGPKTKIGAFADHMYCRYGVSTWSVLNGETVFDLWNGSGLDTETFEAMLAVRNGTSTLPHFDLDTIQHLMH